MYDVNNIKKQIKEYIKTKPCDLSMFSEYFSEDGIREIRLLRGVKDIDEENKISDSLGWFLRNIEDIARKEFDALSISLRYPLFSYRDLGFDIAFACGGYTNGSIYVVYPNFLKNDIVFLLVFVHEICHFLYDLFFCKEKNQFIYIEEYVCEVCAFLFLCRMGFSFEQMGSEIHPFIACATLMSEIFVYFFDDIVCCAQTMLHYLEYFVPIFEKYINKKNNLGVCNDI